MTPLILKRTLPSGKYELFKINELNIIDDDTIMKYIKKYWLLYYLLLLLFMIIIYYYLFNI